MGILRKKWGRYTIVNIYCSWSDIKTKPRGHDVGKSQIDYLFK